MQRIEIVLADVDQIIEIGGEVNFGDEAGPGITTEDGHVFRLDPHDCRLVAPLFRRPIKITLVIEQLPEGAV